MSLPTNTKLFAQHLSTSEPLEASFRQTVNVSPSTSPKSTAEFPETTQKVTVSPSAFSETSRYYSSTSETLETSSTNSVKDSVHTLLELSTENLTSSPHHLLMSENSSTPSVTTSQAMSPEPSSVDFLTYEIHETSKMSSTPLITTSSMSQESPPDHSSKYESAKTVSTPSISSEASTNHSTSKSTDTSTKSTVTLPSSFTKLFTHHFSKSEVTKTSSIQTDSLSQPTKSEPFTDNFSASESQTVTNS
ncbi:endochitinase A-like [Tachysurus fulvidraco]|uniref:endochitinase A-like n=1 Tax=Tachysurus fulvidraco TaxID=1234273 RepID=UPI001FEEBCDF|nr:endochitinase A-like [Tachysurus fulvidraco]